MLGPLMLAAAGALVLKPGDSLHGFTVTSVTDLPEVPAKMVRMAYAKNGAELVWLDREDDNMTFAVVFKTLPYSSDGVAHVLEHSVLCGSEKYPVKEPFVDLAKSSLATFLNAMTWPDKTAYPVSSRNCKDFLNLVDVYLDAAFHPLCVTNDWTLKQEGWHYELEIDPQGTERLVRNGVVYSEMKGSFAEPGRVAGSELDRMLFPGNCYRHCSGGNPKNIPELTQEKFKAFHTRYYHPSNARIFLDGRVDLDTTLAKLDEYLSPYERKQVDAEIPLQTPVSGSARISYESAETTNRVILADGWVVGTFADRERVLALDVLASVLAGSNEAPLKKALLDARLCEDVSVWGEPGQQVQCTIYIQNTSEDKVAECRACVRRTIERLCREGLDRRQVEAQLNRLEFQERERDAGWRPLGLSYMCTALDSWLYGGDPAAGFWNDALFASLRKKLKEGAFERYLREMLLDNPHHAEVTLVPSKTLGAERVRAQAAELAAIKARMSAEELEDVRREAEALKERQKRPDRPEDVAKLPRLGLKDIPLEGPAVTMTAKTVDGTTLVCSEAHVNGIFYLRLCFSLKGLTEAELLQAPILASVLGELATAKMSARDVRDALDGKLGRFEVSVESNATGPQLVIVADALDQRRAEALELSSEIALGTRYDDLKAIGNILFQRRVNLERGFRMSGDNYAARRAARGLSEANRLSELFDGVAQLRHVQALCAATDQSATAAALAALAKKVFVRNRMTVCATGVAREEEFVRACSAAFPVGDQIGAAAEVAGPDKSTEGFEIPAPIGFAALAFRLPPTHPYCGSQRVAARIISYDYLWNEIRVQGGAYRASLAVLPSGDIQATTYRDPNPARSLGKLRGSGAALRQFLASGESFEKFQVSALGKSEPYLSPRSEAWRDFWLYFSGRTSADLARLRQEILKTSRADLERFAAVLEDLVRDPRTCVVAGKTLLAPCALERTEPVQEAARQRPGN